MKSRIIFFLFTIGWTCCIAQKKWQIVRSELIVAHPPFKQCHASTIVELSRDRFMAAWFGGSGEGAKDVVIWTSICTNGRWDPPVVAATGIVNDTLRYPCWNPVLFKNSKGRLMLFYKVGPTVQQWWGMLSTSVDDGKTWSAPVRLPDGILGPIKNKPVQLAAMTILAPSSTETTYKWSVHLEKSDDNGNTWRIIPVDTAGFDAIQPSILSYGHGKLQILCRSKQGNVVQSWSFDNGKTWSPLSRTELPNPNSGTDAITLKDGSQLIVYNPDTPGKAWYNGRGRLHAAISEDGSHWTDILTLENGTTEEYSYPAVIQTIDGLVHITYTHDRKNITHVVLLPPGLRH